MSTDSSSSDLSASGSGASRSKKEQKTVTTKTRTLQWNGIHALAIAAATLFGYWGYQLYLTGVGLQSKVSMKGTLPSIKFDMSGTGPGLLFMAFGAMVIMVALLTLKNPNEKKD